MKRILALAMILLLTLSGAIAEESNESFIVSFTDTLPDILLPSVLKTEWAAAQPISGYVCCRAGQWTYGQMILEDPQGYILCGMVYTGEEWEITASRTALRQGEAPVLETEAVVQGYSGYEISQSGGCNTFLVAYKDARYSWFSSSQGWRLSGVTSGADTVSITDRILNWNGQEIFNTQPVTLSEFNISAFPKTLTEAQEMVDKSPLADAAIGMTAYRADDDQSGGVYAPLVPMLDGPNEDSKVTGRYFSGIDVDILEENNGYVKVRIAGKEGWLKRENVRIGAERAEQFAFGGRIGMVYTAGPKRSQPVYAKPSMDGTPLAQADAFSGVKVLGITQGGEWLQVDADGQAGWMRFDAVCEIDNFYDAWIYSEDPARRLNLRAAPDVNSESRGKYYSGVRVVRLFPEVHHEGWARVIIEGISGWVKTEFLDFSSNYSGMEWLPPTGRVTGEAALDLYEGADSDSAVIERYSQGTAAEILGIMGSWAHVRMRDGNTGYMTLKGLGGEPKAAAANKFLLFEDVVLHDFVGTTLGTMPAGTAVHITERPFACWHLMQNENHSGAANFILTFGEPNEISVTKEGEESGGYIPAALLDMGW